MTREEFEKTALEAQQLAKRNLGEYEKSLVRLINRGQIALWVYVIGCIFLSITLVGILILLRGSGAVWIVLGVVLLLVSAGTIIRSLVMPPPKEKGIRVSREEAPRLWQMTDEVRTKLNAPLIHEIVINHMDNAFAVERKRFGRRQFIVVLGLPQLIHMPPDDLRALLGHELAHHVGGDAGQSMQIYRSSFGWQTALAATGNQQLLNMPVRWFASKYLPKLEAVSLVQSRRCEEIADRLAGVASSHSAVIRMTARPRLSAFSEWVDLCRKIMAQPTLENCLGFYGKSLKLSKAVTEEQILHELTEELKEETTFTDTHPRLNDRLKALGVADPRDPVWTARMAKEIKSSLSPSALEWIFESDLEAWLGRFSTDLATNFDQAMHRDSEDFRVKELSRVAESDRGSWAPYHFEKMAGLLGEENYTQALEAVEEGLVKFPGNTRLLHMKATILAERNPTEALAILEEVAQRDTLRRGWGIELRLFCLNRLHRTQDAYDLTWKWDQEGEEWSRTMNESVAFKDFELFQVIEPDDEAWEAIRRVQELNRFSVRAFAVQKMNPNSEFQPKFIVFQLIRDSLIWPEHHSTKFVEFLQTIPEFNLGEWFSVCSVQGSPALNYLKKVKPPHFVEFKKKKG